MWLKVIKIVYFAFYDEFGGPIMPKLVELCLLHHYDIQIQQITTYNRKPVKGLTLKNG